ncbi:hypothetical protein [Streptomyces albidoflavus]|uniref:hypothetical protein n=1 Tax=Streptomyces albidoflavus TaxID=1886 RepID=UPI0033BFA435
MSDAECGVSFAHRAEMLLPLHHMMEAGFGVDVATLSGNPVKLELWAMPQEDQAVRTTYEALKPQLKQPLKLSEVVAGRLGPDSDHLAVFIPGGHGAMTGPADSEEVTETLDWAPAEDRFVITLCHGPAALISAARGKESSPFAGYAISVFPDALDTGANLEIGYLPGPLPWLVADRLSRQGVTILNSDITGLTHQDRKLLTGDSPLAANALGLLAADALVEAAAATG